MSDVLDETGLKVKSYSEISDELKNKFQDIYGNGNNLNLESNTQDGQMIGLFAQSGTDIRELIQNAWNDLFADTAQGMALDRLFSLVNVPRKKGEKARILVTIVTDKAVELKGLDGGDYQDSAFRINDGKGNDFLLEQSQNFKEAGLYKVYFEALNSGYIFIEPDSFTNIVTPVAGVVSVSNDRGKKAKLLITITMKSEDAVELKGLDGGDNRDGVFRISDGKGNDFLLEKSLTLIKDENNNGVYEVYFEALNGGCIFVEPYSLVKIFNYETNEYSNEGVVSVSNGERLVENDTENNNGSDFEDDFKFRNRVRLGNLANRNKGSKELMEAALLELERVESVIVKDGEENGSVSVVVKGGKGEDIANAIYRTKAAGIKTKRDEDEDGEKKHVEFVINGTSITFYPAKEEPLQYKLTVRDKYGMASGIDEVAIKEVILSNKFDINEEVNQLQIADKVYNGFRNLVITDSKVRKYDSKKNGWGDWKEFATPDENNYFVIDSYVNIIISNAHKDTSEGEGS